MTNKNLILKNYVNYIINIKSKDNLSLILQNKLFFDLPNLSEKELLWIIIYYKKKQKKKKVLLINNTFFHNNNAFSNNLNYNLNYIIWCYFYGLFLIENL